MVFLFDGSKNLNQQEKIICCMTTTMHYINIRKIYDTLSKTGKEVWSK